MTEKHDPPHSSGFGDYEDYYEEETVAAMVRATVGMIVAVSIEIGGVLGRRAKGIIGNGFKKNEQSGPS